MAVGPKTVYRSHSGTTKLHRLQENVGAVAVTLEGDDLAKIQKALAQIQIIGERYPEALRSMVGK